MDFEEAITAWWAGSSAPIALINPKKKGIVAYHEAGRRISGARGPSLESRT